MDVTCPSCRTAFRVDPARVPSSGVRARCSRCGSAFRLGPLGAAPEEGMPEPRARPQAAAVPSAVPGSSPAAEGTPGSQSRAAFPFGAPDPETRARRIARALVSDIVAYHGPRRDDSLRGGTLRQDFREEILKSWEEYVAQVGVEQAKSTPYFREALNDILAKGRGVF